MVDMWMDVDAALAEVPINVMALTDDTDFKTREESVAFDQSGLDLLWNFTTTAGATSQTAVTPTDTAGDYDWVNQGNGYYTIEIPASGGGTINNDTEGFGYFSGFATGVLPWRGPVIGFRAAAINNDLVDAGSALAKAAALTTVDGKLPAALIGGRMNSDAQALQGESGAAIRMSRFFLAGRHGVAQGGTAGTITLAPGAVTDDGFFNGSTVVLSANTARRQFRLITSCTAADDVAVITPDWIITPDDSTEYVIIPFGLSDAVAISGSVAAADSITEARMAALTDWIDGGRLDTLLDAIPTDAMRGTDGANTTTPNNAGITTIINDLANGADGLGALRALLAAIPTTAMRGTDSAALASVCTEARLIKLASLVFTIANLLDVNIQRVNDGAVTGTGASGDEWGP